MEEQERTVDFAGTIRTFLGVLEKRKWFAIGVLIATVGATLLMTSRQKPVYRATSTVIIERRSPTVLSTVQEVVELGSSDYWSMKEYMQTQYEILRSRRLAKRVVDRLTLGLDEHFLGLADRTPPLTVAEIRTKMAEMDAVEILLTRVNIEPRQDSQMALVSVDDSDPHMAKLLANTLVEEYREANLEYKKRVVAEAISELRSMLISLRQEKETAESKLLEFERRHSMVSLESRRKQVLDELDLLNSKYVHAGIDRIGVETSSVRDELVGRIMELEEILESKDHAGAAHPVLVANPNMTSLKIRLVEFDANVREKSGRYGPKHPVMQAAYSQRSLVRKAMQTEAKTLLESELGSLRHQLEVEDNKLRDSVDMQEELGRQLLRAREQEGALAKLELDYGPLKTSFDEANKVYEEVKARYSETSLSAQVETNNVRIQDLASAPTSPVKPNKKLNFLVGLVIGLLLGVGAAYFVESLDSTLKTRDDIEAIDHVAFLGLVPAVEGVDLPEGNVPHDCPELYMLHYPKSSIAESFRIIRTNLSFSRQGFRPKRFLITSPGPKEGKTTVGVNLAAVSAASGSRTLVIDTDMRRPRVHRLLGIPRRPGITEYFLGNQPIIKFCRATPVPGMDVLTCGTVSPNPIEILESEKFAAMVEELATEYDTIVFDSPPLLAVADAKIVSSLIDCAVMVVRAGITTKEALREAREMMYPMLSDDVGVILNGFDVEKHSYRYYYYRSKRYGYYSYYTYDEQESDSVVPEKNERRSTWAKRSA